MENENKNAEDVLREIKNTIDNFDKSLTFEEIVLHGHLQRFISANDYLYLISQITSLLDSVLDEE